MKWGGGSDGARGWQGRSEGLAGAVKVGWSEELAGMEVSYNCSSGLSRMEQDRRPPGRMHKGWVPRAATR